MRLLTVAALLSIGLSVPVPGSVWGVSASSASYQQPGRTAAAAVALGPMNVQPSQVRVGQLVTITGRTTGRVQFLPPFVEMQSAQTVPAHIAPGPCQGTSTVSAAQKVVVLGGGGGGKGSRAFPQAGTPWKVQFRVPKVMTRLQNNLSTVQVTPPLGTYYLTAIAAGMEPPCGLSTRGGRYVSVATIKLVNGTSGPAKIFQPIMPALRRTGVPLLLPTLQSLNRYYASIVASSAGHYDVFMGYVPNCQGDACEYGELSAQKLGAGAQVPKGIRVILTGGVTGYFVNFACGASCGASTVTVDVHGYRYIYGIKAGKQSEVVALANSALMAGPA